MGWSIGGPDERGRWVGYGVPAFCDHPKCNAEIDRGLAHVCGGEPYGGDTGCGLYFCGAHLNLFGNLCPRCAVHRPTPYARIKPEHSDWLRHLLTDESWAEWRSENVAKVAKIRAEVEARERQPVSA